MNSEKTELLTTILSLIFGDYNSSIIEELTTHKISFRRPNIATSIYNKFLLTWDAEATFQVYGVVGKEKPVGLNFHNWKRVSEYLKSNKDRAGRFLKVTV